MNKIFTFVALKNKILRKLVKNLFLSILVFNIILIVLSYNIFVNDEYKNPDEIGFKEKYDENLFNKIKDMKQLNEYFQKEAKEKKILKSDIAYLNLASQIVKERFYYDGYAYYNIDENVILYFLGKFVWDDFAAIVLPDDILKKKYAACSQQSIILMELVKSNGFDVRKVQLKSHFVLEIKMNDEWLFFDPTLEPKLDNNRTSLKNLLHKKYKLIKAYKHVIKEANIDEYFSKIKYGTPNKFPATKMKILHSTTKIYIRHLILISFLIFALYYVSRKQL